MSFILNFLSDFFHRVSKWMNNNDNVDLQQAVKILLININEVHNVNQPHKYATYIVWLLMIVVASIFTILSLLILVTLLMLGYLIIYVDPEFETKKDR